MDIINDEDDEDIFDSVEHLWEENSALKSSLNTLENSLLTITETLSEVRKSLENQEKKIMDNLKRIESNLDSKVVTFSKELEKSFEQRLKQVKNELSEKYERSINTSILNLKEEFQKLLTSDLETIESSPPIIDINKTDIMEEFKSEIYSKLAEFEKSLELSHSRFSDLEKERSLNNSSLTATIYNNLENRISRTESELHSLQKSIINPSIIDSIIAQMNEKDKKLSELFNTKKNFRMK